MGQSTLRNASRASIVTADRVERQLAGALILAEPERRRAALESVYQGDIADAAVGAVVRAIRQLVADGRPVDPVQIADVLTRRGEWEEVVSGTQLSEMMNSVASAADLAFYADEVAAAGAARYAKGETEKMVSLIGTSGRDAAEWKAKFAEVHAVLDQRATARRHAETPQDRRRRLGLMTGKEMVAAHPKEKPEVVSGLFRQGELVTLTSTTKAGKTWYALRLARAVSEGRPWLGRRTEAGPVLYLDFELQPANLSARIKAIMGGDEPPDSDQLLYRALRGVRDGWGKSRQILESFGPDDGLRLVVIDPLYKAFAASGGKDESDNVAAGEFMHELIEHCDRLGCALLTTGHAAKGQTGERALTDLTSGAGAFSRAADAILALRQGPFDKHLVHQAILRSLPSPPDETIRVVFPDGRGWDYELAPDVEPVVFTGRGKPPAKPTAETISGDADIKWDPAPAGKPKPNPETAAAALLSAGHRHQKAAAADRIHEWFGVSKAAAKGLVRDAVDGGYLREWDEGRKAFVGPPDVSNRTLPELG
jgi:hypothetical protein